MEQTRNDWLDGIDIAAPCSADWNEMAGDDRCRFCDQCSLHVFDLSAMTRPQAEKLVAERTGKDARLCVRFTRRADGTVLTRDCPVGLRVRVRHAASRVVAMCTAAFAFLGCRGETPNETTPGKQTPIEQPEVEPLQGEICVMGDVAIPPVGTPPVTIEPRQIMGRIANIPPIETPEQPPKKPPEKK